MKKTPLTIVEHSRLGKMLKEMNEMACLLRQIIGSAHNLSDPVSISAKKMYMEINKLRNKLDESMYENYPIDDIDTLYYSNTDVLQELTCEAAGDPKIESMDKVWANRIIR